MKMNCEAVRTNACKINKYPGTTINKIKLKEIIAHFDKEKQVISAHTIPTFPRNFTGVDYPPPNQVDILVIL